MTPQALLDRLVALLPGFAGHWDDPGNCFREDDGSFNSFGVFAMFSGYFWGDHARHPAPRLAALGELVSECMDSADVDLANAAALAFLEPRAGESEGECLKHHLGGEALRYWRGWE